MTTADVEAAEAAECSRSSLLEEEQLLDLLNTVVQTEGRSAADLHHAFACIVTRYQEQPQLLDSLLQRLLDPLGSLLDGLIRQGDAVPHLSTLVGLSRWIWTLATVRGRRTVLRFLPNNTQCLEPVVALLETLQTRGPAGFHDTCMDHLWEAECVLLLWLSHLVLVPFDLASLDSQLGDGERAALAPLAASILRLCQAHLSSPSRAREMAAEVLGRCVTRPDMAAALEESVTWAETRLAGMGTDACEAGFLVPGILLALAATLRHGDRARLGATALRLLPLAQRAQQATQGGALARRLSMKLMQRIGLVLLPPAGDVAKEPGLMHGSAIEDVLDALLTGLGDKDTVVRWSAAKGVGRVAGGLPPALARQVAASVAEAAFGHAGADAAWHGGCLALAELARRRLLDPREAGATLRTLRAALRYDLRRGPCSVGAHVRDAAAYVAWALARAWTPAELGAVVGELGPPLITLACLDREVNCRRAGAAAFQELVGRLGEWPHGIDILTAADYFTVSSRVNAYRCVAVQVATFPGYFLPLASHLLHVKLRHWEKALRELASLALADLTRVDADWLAGTALPTLLPLTESADLESRHGAVAGVAELVAALPREALTPFHADLAQILPRIDAAKLNRGKGGEVMRTALCRLAATISQARVPLSAAQAACMQATLLDCLRCAAPDAQTAAVAALGSYALASGAGPDLAHRLLASLRGGATAAERRGAARGLAVLPPGQVPAGALLAATQALAAAADPASGAEADVDVRSAAVAALADLAGACVAAQSAPALTLCALGLGAALAALGDYTVDNRGDVGSWAREAALRALPGMLRCRAGLGGADCKDGGDAMRGDGEDGAVFERGDCHGDAASEPRATERFAFECVAAACKQGVERIGRVRRAARDALRELADGELLPHSAAPAICAAVAHAVDAADLAAADEDAAELASLARLLSVKALAPAVLAGLVHSVGGRDAQVAAAAADALAGACCEAGAASGRAVGGAFLRLWDAEAGGAQGRRSPESGAPCGAPEASASGSANRARRAHVQRLAGVPLLASAEVLLARTPLAGDAAFQLGLLERLRVEVARRGADLPRLQAVAALLGALGSGEACAQPARRLLWAMLGSRFPAVRRSAAEYLYLALLSSPDEAEDGMEAEEQALELLGERNWAGPAGEVADLADQVAALLKLQGA
ncbi:hypothetical protein ACKKBF_B36615 [Auxenochlorella protothecoides x Auxenochlorella symbiontica]